MTSFISAFKEYLVRWCDEDSVSVVPDSQITKSSDDTCMVKWGKACYHGAIVASGKQTGAPTATLNDFIGDED